MWGNAPLAIFINELLRFIPPPGRSDSARFTPIGGTVSVSIGVPKGGTVSIPVAGRGGTVSMWGAGKGGTVSKVVDIDGGARPPGERLLEQRPPGERPPGENPPLFLDENPSHGSAIFGAGAAAAGAAGDKVAGHWEAGAADGGTEIPVVAWETVVCGASLRDERAAPDSWSCSE